MEGKNGEPLFHSTAQLFSFSLSALLQQWLPCSSARLTGCCWYAGTGPLVTKRYQKTGAEFSRSMRWCIHIKGSLIDLRRYAAAEQCLPASPSWQVLIQREGVCLSTDHH